MKLPPKILLEGWNFCNRCGRACTVGPRWADCVGPDGTQRVTPAENAAGLPLDSQNQSNCDAFTEQKERTLGGYCGDPMPGNASLTSFFWTAMLKSGAMNVSERGRLCGLWCADKDPDCNTPTRLDVSAAADVTSGALAAAPTTNWTDDNYMMRQPRVLHEWSAPDGGSGGWRGSFYGTYDEGANLSALPTPAELIEQALGPPGPPGCSLAGAWLGQGDPRLTILVSQAPGAAAFNASCQWSPGPGLPTPWENQNGTVDGSNRVLFHVAGHVDSGIALLSGADVRAPPPPPSAVLVCWSSTSWWCRGDSCAGGAAACAQAAPLPVSSYFGMEWVARNGTRVHRHVLRAGTDLTWLMLYTGPEAATGLKGGYEWDGRGQYAPTPLSTARNATQWNPAWGPRPTNDFQVVQWTNISLWPGGPGFYFLNMGACWKDSGVECDGDITTDVTRYLLFQLPAPAAAGAAAATGAAPIVGPGARPRCGPGAESILACPPYHRYRNGTVVPASDAARFPFAAYHSVSSRRREGGTGNFTCKHDCWSNPCDQDWVRIEPAPEWAEYGFPASVAEAMEPRRWVMDVGAVTAELAPHFSGQTPPLLAWTTLNVGPEMQAAPGATAVWELAESDVLVRAPT